MVKKLTYATNIACYVFDISLEVLFLIELFPIKAIIQLSKELSIVSLRGVQEVLQS